MDGFLVCYNAYQTVFNTWAVYEFLAVLYERRLPLAGTFYKPGREEARLGFALYCHFQNKYVEFFDTLFMVVRKKNDQVTYLHVWHHVLILWAWLVTIRWNPGGDAYFGALVNSAIHVV